MRGVRWWSSLALAVPLAAATAAQLPQTEPREVRLDGPAPTVFQQLGNLYQVELRVEPEFPPRRLRLHLTEADFATALRVAARLAGAFWVVQPDGTVLLAEDTEEKRQRYQPRVLTTFHLPGRTPEELTEMVRLLREVLDMRLLRAEPDSNTFTVRDTPWRLQVARRLLEQVDTKPGEVRLDVVVLEVDRERALDLGLLPPDQAVIVHLGAGALVARRGESLLEVLQFLFDQGLVPDALASQVSVDLATQQVTLPPFVVFGGGGTAFAANLPGARLSLQEISRAFRSVRRFSLRARHGQEATLFSGRLFPVTFTTFSSIFIPEIVQELQRRGEFVPPVPATRYEELGTRVTAVPHLHSPQEISLRLQVTQEELTGRDLNGIPIFSARQVEEHVRLKEGETLLLGGLRSRTREETRTQTPLLGSLPLLGHLFKRTETRTRTTELIVLVTPRLVLRPEPERAALRPLYVGTESEFAPATTAPPQLPSPPGRPPSPERPEPPEERPSQQPPQTPQN